MSSPSSKLGIQYPHTQEKADLPYDQQTTKNRILKCMGTSSYLAQRYQKPQE